ncbi:bifunctional 2',3'-cyclic-nucleotide 2'-phosphodiesterase/3'-nucleotidase [Mesotoga prima]|uniref:bifunctional 2',3'-cyclic-nucleotide 2'-phosphodiesterase/3'-nucleotidase n=3 Tax=Mesotoga prima TaxID=1184387 RepID=UPI0002CB70C5|nr:bifunctional 2',3'-cyclic-nucleotide 2'-phosphodiesterase/3'-nucleotidase [Mesotoga prima]CCU84968.1 5'-Nucleotidase domain protein [Mesotoga infera]HNQ71271.1 bifunctional 2',3'-cyclic-nucleotide 2'-phosphodiesterase/3'-nucleotidase [Mesotoga prima]HNS76296.1 bifunctional 2',3'-cyclic-nucleotide 2'-phosphodiesterase/3'-nucleotidase [Mesotoga prima]HPA00535.1 bifunctional 2',3'-cyclic-nucleotide 2'-phosphodiesterase/3'-nucleotidase [Mesotoga prima]HUM23065.1 bifunctional 2',3'-cyclic-nucleo
MLEKRKSIATVLLILLAFSSLLFSATGKTVHNLVIMGTTDMHQYIMPYDYMGDKPNESIGLAKVFTLIEKVRSANANTLLFDTGDFIQGSLVGDYEADVNPLEGFDFQTIVRAYNYIGYDAVSVGNHDVTDFGLEFFERARSNSVFPWVSANIRMVEDPKDFLVNPFVILEREVDGIPIRIGVIGFTPPQIMSWGRRHLEGTVFTQTIIEQAEKYIRVLKDQSDLVVAVAHTGISTDEITSYDAQENAAYYLAQVEGIDAMILGHQHSHFPGDFADIEGIDNDKGLIFGVPTVQPGSWGSHLGIINLDLAYDWTTGDWEVLDGSASLVPVTPEVETHRQLAELVAQKHEATIEYVRTPIGWTDTEITSYFSRIIDNPVTQIINEAQIWWAEREFAGSEYEWLPVLSAAAPFIAGRQGPTYFTHVQGDITIGSITDIYIYPNTIYVAKLNGEQIKDWLEASANNFNQIDPYSTEPQHIVNYDFREYNFDVIEGIDYVYDISRPAGQRLISATFEGNPLDASMEFLVVTNNYRGSGGGNFPHVADNVILATTEINREAIIKYIQYIGEIDPVPTNNWKILPIDTAGPLLYRSSPEGVGYIERNAIRGIEFIEVDEAGWGIYEVDLVELAKYLEDTVMQEVK